MHFKFIFLKDLKTLFIAGLLLTITWACNKPDDSKNPAPTVFIEQTKTGYRLIRNGEAFYIKGGAANSQYLEELKEAGANTARIYDTINLKETLDRAEDLGLAVVVDIPMPKFVNDPEFYENQELFELMKSRIERVVQKHKDHPALLYWNLGNELYYPYFYKITDFFSNFNILIDLIHTTDPNHPISTTTIGANKLRVLSIHRKSPKLDFISFNSFGVLSSFSRKLRPIAPFWTGPHVITEWGINGPWEAQLTEWSAPIEETSTKKAEQIKQRYHDYIEPLRSNNSLGSFVFYWGKKDEVTPTWYSLFGDNKSKTQAVFELAKIWSDNKLDYKGPELDFILLNDKGALESIILSPQTEAEAEVILPESKIQNIEYNWEIRRESWYKSHESILAEGIHFQKKANKVIFKTPKNEGPYRLFLYLTNESDYFATANIPFYVLKPNNGE